MQVVVRMRPERAVAVQEPAMLGNPLSTSPSNVVSQPGELAEAAPLTSLVYRSRAVAPFDEAGLQALLDSAQRRNREAAVTGILIYDDGRFMQWLEGPAEGVSRVWQVTRADSRHTDIEVLGDAPTSARFFPDWAMKLGTRDADLRSANDRALAATQKLMDSLRWRPEAVRAALSSLVLPHAASLNPPDRELLRQVVGKVVIPRLTGILPQLLPDPAAATPDARMAELARLLVAADPAEAFALLDVLQSAAGSLLLYCATVAEPAARGLGDLWAADDCSEFEVSLGLGRLQQAFRRLSADTAYSRWQPQVARVVLVAPQPGEQHMLGAALDAELLWRAGWDAHCEFPVDDDALRALVAGTWFDAIDLTLSASFRREHWQSRMAASIAAARSASVNPGLAVVVGGRVFHDQTHSRAPFEVGADVASATAAHIVQILQRTVLKR